MSQLSREGGAQIRGRRCEVFVRIGVVVLLAGCSSGPAVRGTAANSTRVSSVPVSSVAVPAPTTTAVTSTATTVGAARIEGDLTAGEVAEELTTIERRAATGDASVGVRQQLLYRYLSAHPQLDAAVIAAVGDDVRPFVERIVAARQFGQARSAARPPGEPTSQLPAWTVVDPLPSDQLLAYYADAEAATGVPWFWLAAIHLQETRIGRIIGTSSAGAVGPMQFLPATWARCCTGDPTVPADAILGAATYLQQSGAPADMAAALHVYNPNDSYVATVNAFAENLRDQPQLFDVYREWQVFYATSAGTIRLPIGYHQAQPIDAAAYLADHPEDAAS